MKSLLTHVSARTGCLLNLIVIFAFFLPLSHAAASLPDPSLPAQTSAANLLQVQVIVLVNSESPSYADFTHWIQPYLENFGVPYRTIDLAQQALPADLKHSALIMIGHARIDPQGKCLDQAVQRRIVRAVSGGVGLINFDNDLSLKNGAPRYDFIQKLFAFRYTSQKTSWGVRLPDPGKHYITALHPRGEELSTGSMLTAGLIASDNIQVLALTGSGQPFIAAAQAGQGRVVQWTSYDWLSDPAVGPLSGFDDLVWRSLVWAARKPFVMQSMPPFVTMRVDDVSGPLWWAHTASEEFSLKPWLGVFINDFTAAEATDLSNLVREGKATALVHAFTMENFFYANHSPNGKDNVTLPPEMIERNMALGLAWHQKYNIPLSQFTVGHYYEMSANAFEGLQTWGIQYVGTLVEPGAQYGSNRVQAGPYQAALRGSSKSTKPFSYADYVSVPGQPEMDGKFFNCMTEIRDDAGYEWFPGRDVPGSIGRGVRQTRRALDSLVLATLFTHEYHILEAGPQKWNAILQGVTSQLAAQHPIYVTLDHACQYSRAIHDSRIASSSYAPGSRQITITLEGKTNLPTMLALFTEKDGQIEQRYLNVPVVTGQISLSERLP